MIDGWGVFSNALWIGGLAWLLAVLAAARYHAAQNQTPLRQALAAPGRQVQVSLLASLLLVGLGLALAPHAWWQRLPGAALALLCVGQLAWSAWQRRTRHARAGTSRACPRLRPGARLGRLLVVSGLLLILVWVVLTAVQLYGHARSLQAHVQAVEDLAAGQGAGLNAAGLSAAGQHLAGMRRDLEVIQARVGPLLPAGRLLRWVPVYGGDLAAAGRLLELATGVARAGDVTFQALSPAVDLLAGGNEGGGVFSAGEQLLPQIVAAQPALRQAQADLAAVDAARQEIDVAALSPRVAGLVERLDRYLPWFQTGVNGALLLPGLLGADGPRTYLIVAQNNQELRATGGFISGVGELRVDRGRIELLGFRDSYAVDNLAVAHEVAPLDFQRVLLGDLIFFRDANWDPHFPTSAQRALDIYARDQGVQAHGVVALDLTALRYLVQVAGPLSVEGIDTPVEGNNLVQVLQGQWGTVGGETWRDWWLHRKDFMGDIAAALVARLSQGQELDPVGLAQAVKQALDEKHVLVYLTEPGSAALLQAQGWGGTLPDPAAGGDALLAVDTNVGFNKVDVRVERSILYQVDLSSSGAPRARLAITYHHTGQQPVGDCVQEAVYGDEYQDMFERCYWDYVRVYVPGGSRLVEGPALPLPPGSLLARMGPAGASPAISPTLSGLGAEGAGASGDWAAWTAFFTLSPLEERTLTWSYDLAPTAVRIGDDGLAEYRLHVQKQPGTEAVPLAVEIRLPPGVQLLAGELVVHTDLRQDRDVAILFRNTGP